MFRTAFSKSLVRMSAQEASAAARDAAIRGFTRVVHFDVEGARVVVDEISFGPDRTLKIARRIVTIATLDSIVLETSVSAPG